MDSLHQRLENAFDYLYHKGVVHSKAQFGERIGKKQKSNDTGIPRRAKALHQGFNECHSLRVPRCIESRIPQDGEGEVGLPDKDLKPHYPATVAAGVLSGDVVQVMDYDVVLEPPIKRLGQYDYMIDVEGSSMEPTYYTGDTVACRKLTDNVN